MLTDSRAIVVLGRSEVQYDFNDLTPVLANGTGAVVYARTGAGVTGPQDLLNRAAPLKFGGISATEATVKVLMMLVCSPNRTSFYGFSVR